MKRILVAMLLCSATAAFGQGEILFENTDATSVFINLDTPGNPNSGSGLVVQLYWYNGSSFVLEDTFTSTFTGYGDDGQGPGYFTAGEVTIPQAGTQTFEVDAFYTYQGTEYSGTTGGFTAYVSSNRPPVTTDSGSWEGDILLSPLVAPEITNQPVSISTFVGSNVTLNVTPVYHNIAYQWQFDGTNIAEATNNSLNFTNIQLTNAGYYDVVLSNTWGVLTSATVAVSVGPPGAPSVYVNSNLAALTASAAVSASVSLVSGFSNGYVFYTLDGSPPTGGSTRYTSPFTLTNSTTIQAIGYSSDFSQSATMQPLALIITPPLTITTSVSGNGSIGLSPDTSTYAAGSVVTLTATAGSNYTFEQWEGSVSSTNNPLDVTVTSNLNVEAVFVQSAYPLTLDTAGGGTVTANGQSLTGPTYFSTNGVVTLTATPNSGWTFAGWQDGITSTNNPYYLQMTGPYGVEGIFQTVVQTSTGGGGQIVLNRTYPLPYGSTMTASAVPSNGNYFVLWSGLASGTNNPVVVTVTNTEISALFAALPANKLTLSVVVLSRGSVGINPQQSYYDYGDQVTLTASWNVASGYSFNGWSGAVNDTNSTTVVTVTTNMVVYANFSPVPQPTLAVGLGAQGPVLLVSELAGQYNEVIYCSTDLVSWQPIYTNAPVTGSFQYTDTNASNVPIRYYRAAVTVGP